MTTNLSLEEGDKLGLNELEEFYTQKMTEYMGKPITVAFMRLNFDEIDIPNPPYHKGISAKYVKEIAENFHPGIAQFLTCNIRATGKIALVDGRHRRDAMIARGEPGWLFLVTNGLSVPEEAKMFRYFQARKNMNAAERIHGLILEGDAGAVGLRSAINSSGYCFPFEQDSRKKKIHSVGALMGIFAAGGKEGVRKVLDVSNHAWMDERHATHGTLLLGLWIFISHPEVKGKMSRDDLVAALKDRSPGRILDDADISSVKKACGKKHAVAYEIAKLWNKKAGRGRKAPETFGEEQLKGGHSFKRRGGELRSRFDPKSVTIPDHLREEIHDRKSKGDAYGKQASQALRNAAIQMVRQGISLSAVATAYGCSKASIGNWIRSAADKNGKS